MVVARVLVAIAAHRGSEHALHPALCRCRCLLPHEKARVHDCFAQCKESADADAICAVVIWPQQMTLAPVAALFAGVEH